ncbi:MAG: radical SAM protein [Sphingomonadaceae bacterium]
MQRYATADGILLRDRDVTALFRADTMSLSLVEDSRMPLERLSHDLLRETPASETSFALDRRGAILPLLFGTNARTPKPLLGRFTINISNACNLACEYCYADHGLYHSPKSLMSPARAEALVARITAMYREVRTVHYFGGEPLMNIAAIDAIGNAFEQAVADGRLPSLPSFVATTNGTLSGTRVLQALKRWGIELTVSWDGPDAVHDRIRPTATGKSSSRLLRRTLERFDAEGIKYDFECTYCQAHLDAGISVVDLMDFFAAESEGRIFHIAPAVLPDDEQRESELASAIFDDHGDWQKWRTSMSRLVPLYRDAAAVSLRNFLRREGPMVEFAARIIEQLIKKERSQTYCPAFFSQLSVAEDGSVFPCFMFIGDKEFRLGNLFEDDFPNAASQRVFHRYFSEFGQGALGTDAWYAPLSGGCIAGDAVATGSFGRRAMAPIYEAMAEECVIGLARHTTRTEMHREEKING